MENLSAKNTLSGFAHYLVANSLLPEPEVRQALQKAHHDKSSFIFYLVQHKLLNSIDAAKAASNYFGLPLFDITSFDKSALLTNLMNLNLVQKHYVMPLYTKDKRLYMAVVDPTLPNLSEISFITGLNMQLVIVEADKLANIIDETLNAQLITELDDFNGGDLDNLDIGDYDEDALNKDLDIDSAPVVRFINKVLANAISKKASDIHFESYEKDFRIRFRIDGILYETLKPPTKLANYIIARIKVMSNLDISERRIPQDGRFKLNVANNRAIDFRVNTCPTLWGEKVVVRILDSSNELLNIDILGLEEIQRQYFLSALSGSQGMILVTGPTGSGKTVTLYTAMTILNTPDVNISSVEDPVEIHLKGINQVQVNLKAGLTFASALRAFLRQDPDIIMVGEIRDLETAEIAVKASQTGHLVLSTLHTNGAAETLVRLSNMGVAAYNIASSTRLIIAQRLARRLCKFCKQPVNIPKKTLIEQGFNPDELAKLEIFGPKGCEHCNNGYKGRVGIYEVMPISPELGQIIMRAGNTFEIAEQARKENIKNLRESGLDKVRQGITSLDEVNSAV